ncbi:MAG TPA: hypothetical protein PLR83_04195 [Pyrinomonadaceae bacterium]|nr:hypothetical protein [Pyrinomonadaceae bacterium]
MEQQPEQEIWQVEANSEIYQGNFTELSKWIEEGSLLRADKVRKGNLRWIEAGRVPSLAAVFTAVENGQPIPVPVAATEKVDPTNFTVNAPLTTSTPPEIIAAVSAPTVAAATEEPATGAEAPAAFSVTASKPSDPAFCGIHRDLPTAYLCTSCNGSFCKGCPKTYASVKICPSCGAMCESVGQLEKKRREEMHHATSSGGFGFGDFTASIGHPFRFGTSLVVGGAMYAALSTGQAVAGYGGPFMWVAALFCFLFANMLMFGVLSNTAEAFAKGETNSNFFPAFEDFSVWDDILRPFFLSIAAYVVSFGPFFAMMIVLAFFVMGAVKDGVIPGQGIGQSAIPAASELPNAAKGAEQSERIRDLLNKQANVQRDRVASATESAESGNSAVAQQDFDKRQAELNKEFESLTKQAQAQPNLPGVSSPGSETALIESFIRRGFKYILLAGIFMLWGLIYFPAACIVAGYTNSIGATINPIVGLDTMWNLGLDYIRLLLIAAALLIVGGFAALMIAVVLAPFNLPLLGNLPAKFVTSFLGFYLWAVFACSIGFLLFKARSRLKLPT